MGRVWLTSSLFDAAQARGIDIAYGAKVKGLLTDDTGRVTGVSARTPEGSRNFEAGAVVLACGGFESNPEMRTRYLGPGWELAKVRGTRFNTGDGIRIALDAGAQSHGHWSSCHAVAWDLNAPTFGDRNVADLFQKHSYPLGIVVNADGKRFLDEGGRLPELHLCQVWTRDTEAAPSCRFPDIRCQSLRETSGRVLHCPCHESGVGHHSGPCGRPRHRQAEIHRHCPEFQCRRHRRGVQSRRSRRQGDHRNRAAQVQLGAEARFAPIHRLRRDLRHYLHLRWPEDRPRRSCPGHGGRANTGPVRCGGTCRRALLLQLRRWVGADGGVGVREDRRGGGGEGGGLGLDAYC